MIKKENRISYIRSVPAKILIMALSLGSVGCGFLGPSDSDDDLLPLAGLLALAGAQQAQFDCTDDGLVWTEPVIPATNPWAGVAYGNGLFVAVSTTGSNQIMTSPDAVNWQVSAAPGTATQWYDVVHGGNQFVAVAGANGTEDVMTSPDGTNWTRRSEPANGAWRRIDHGNGVLVAGAETSADLLVSTNNGTSWASVTSPIATAHHYDITYGNGMFLAFDNNSENKSITSTDGTNWNQHSVPTGFWYDSAYGGGRFVAVGLGTTTSIMYSSNGIDGWVTATDPVGPGAYLSVTYGGGLFVAVNYNMSPAVIISTDGINWTTVSGPASSEWSEIIYTNGKFVAVSQSGKVMYSNCD